MYKIQELHGKLFLQEQSVGEYMKDHATITEDLMGRFAEWKDMQGYIPTPDGQGGIKYIKKHSQKQIEYTTSELIQLFKETLWNRMKCELITG